MFRKISDERMIVDLPDDDGRSSPVEVEIVSNAGGLMITFPEKFGGKQIRIDLFDGILSAMFWLEDSEEEFTTKIIIEEVE